MQAGCIPSSVPQVIHEHHSAPHSAPGCDTRHCIVVLFLWLLGLGPSEYLPGGASKFMQQACLLGNHVQSRVDPHPKAVVPTTCTVMACTMAWMSMYLSSLQYISTESASKSAASHISDRKPSRLHNPAFVTSPFSHARKLFEVFLTRVLCGQTLSDRTGRRHSQSICCSAWKLHTRRRLTKEWNCTRRCMTACCRHVWHDCPLTCRRRRRAARRSAQCS